MQRKMRVMAALAAGLVLARFDSAYAGPQPSTAPNTSSEVRFRVAKATPTPGYEKTVSGSGRTIFVSAETLFTNEEVMSAQTASGPDGNTTMELLLTAEIAPRVASYVRGGAGLQVAIMTGDKVLAAPIVKSLTPEGKLSLGGLSSAEAGSLTSVMGKPHQPATPISIGPTITVVPRQTTAQPGGTVQADVFLAKASNVRLYQVTVDATGGSSGTLGFENLVIDKTRPDYVFGTQQVVDAADQTEGRAGAVLFNGSVNVDKPAYLCTYTYKASPDAAGTFNLQVRIGLDSFLNTPESAEIAFRPGSAGTVTIGTPTRTQPTGN